MIVTCCYTIFGGKMVVACCLPYLTTKHDFENFGVTIARFPPPRLWA